jgi:hypothetical protein
MTAFDMVGHGQNDKSGTAVDWYGYGTAHLLHDLLAVVRRFVGSALPPAHAHAHAHAQRLQRGWSHFAQWLCRPET